MLKRFLKTLLCMVLVLVCAAPACMPSVSAAKAAKILKINSDGVRLHYTAEGQGEANMILSMKKGTKVLFLGMKNKSWAEIALSNGLTGYVYKGYLSEYGAVASSSVGQVTTKLACYKKSGSRLKKTSSTLSKGTIVFVRATKNGYAYVTTLSGKKTYVKTSGLKKYSN